MKTEDNKINFFNSKSFRITLFIIFLISVCLIDMNNDDLSIIKSNVANILFILKNSIIIQSQKKKKSKHKKKLNFAEYNRGSSVIKLSSEISFANSIIKDDHHSLLFPMKTIKNKNIEFIITSIEDFYLKEIIIDVNEFYTNFPMVIDLYTSFKMTENSWKFKGTMKLKDEIGENIFILKNHSLCRFIKFVIKKCHNKLNFYNCSINNIKLLGKTITSFKMEFNKKIKKKITKKNYHQNNDEHDDAHNDIISLYSQKIIDLEKKLEAGIKEIEILHNKIDSKDKCKIEKKFKYE